MTALPAVTALLALALASPIADAQTFPSRPIRFVVPYGTGGAPDVAARILSQRMSENLGQQVIIENRPGAGGVAAAEMVMRSPPDGHSLFAADTGHFGINPNLFAKLPYHPLRDFTPVLLVITTPLFMAVGAAVPAGNVRELIALAKVKPGMLYGSSGNGSAHHLGMEMLKTLTGADMSHVPYKGVAQSVPGVLSGDVSVILVGLPSIQPHMKAGKAKVIAVTTLERTHLMPDLPAISEFVSGYDLNPAMGFLAAAGTPRDIVMRLNAEINKVLAVPEIRQRMDALGIVAAGGTPEQFGEQIRADLRKYAKLVKDSGTKVD